MRISAIQSSPVYKALDNTKKETAGQTRDKNKKDVLGYVTLTGVLASALFIANRTSKSRIEDIVRATQAELKAEAGTKNESFNSILNIQNLKDDKNVLSIDDLSGLEQLKSFIRKQQVLIKNRDTMKEYNVKPFSSILLWGVPGTGKTSAAMGIAKKIDADFIRLDKELFDSEFISRGPRQLAEYFRAIEEHAKNNKDKNVVVFMDEIDSTMAIDRGLEAKQDEVLVNTLKKGMTDLQKECDNIIFIGATNKDPNGIKSDNAIIRLNSAILSRFNYQFEIGLPEPKSIKDAWTKLIKMNSGKERFSKKQNEIIAEKFSELGMSYRDIENIANKLNIEDAVEFCINKQFNSKKNLISVMNADEKIGYDYVQKKSLDNQKKQKVLQELARDL